MFYGSFLQDFSSQCLEIPPQDQGQPWGDLGIEAADKCRALRVSSCRRSLHIHGVWEVSLARLASCAICKYHPARWWLTQHTAHHVSWQWNGTLKFFAMRNEGCLKFPERCVWMPGQVQTAFSGRRQTSREDTSLTLSCQEWPWAGFAFCVYFV